mgnify:CR=1 FL=1
MRISTIEVLGNTIISTIIDQKQNLWNVKLKTAGKHYMKNAAALLTLVSSLNLDLSKAILALQSCSPLAGRGQVLEVILKATNFNEAIHLIDESYNANPSSVKSSLETLACIFKNKNGRGEHIRRIAVLGDMLELGSSEVIEHINLSLIHI